MGNLGEFRAPYSSHGLGRSVAALEQLHLLLHDRSLNPVVVERLLGVGVLLPQAVLGQPGGLQLPRELLHDSLELYQVLALGRAVPVSGRGAQRQSGRTLPDVVRLQLQAPGVLLDELQPPPGSRGVLAQLLPMQALVLLLAAGHSLQVPNAGETLQVLQCPHRLCPPRQDGLELLLEQNGLAAQPLSVLLHGGPLLVGCLVLLREVFPQLLVLGLQETARARQGPIHRSLFGAAPQELPQVTDFLELHLVLELQLLDHPQAGVLLPRRLVGEHHPKPLTLPLDGVEVAGPLPERLHGLRLGAEGLLEALVRVGELGVLRLTCQLLLRRGELVLQLPDLPVKVRDHLDVALGGVLDLGQHVRRGPLAAGADAVRELPTPAARGLRGLPPQDGRGLRHPRQRDVRTFGDVGGLSADQPLQLVLHSRDLPSQADVLRRSPLQELDVLRYLLTHLRHLVVPVA
mmetsp:Transcript_66751/g.195892  ORF Transcript_66751/g.195892 Transcript_66751/m.195892 type:complete len:460 (-) Transcript_66751:206-1585(-)